VIAVAAWQGILDGLGAVLAWLYNLVPNYGVAIILLTIVIRVLLLPLAVKQIRSMQAMQAIQPRIKSIQQKYKGKPDARQKVNEETMALYKEYGVNPLGGCLPLLLQFPVLIALFAVLRVPGGIQHVPHVADGVAPGNSRLYNDVVLQHTEFLGANLLCSAQEAGKSVPIVYKAGDPHTIQSPLNCGKGGPSRVPYYAFALAMLGTTYYQQRQMQRATPAGSSQQQQALTRFMPLLFGVWGFLFPAGLVVYWTTTNVLQIIQQQFMLPKTARDQGASGSSQEGGKPQGKPLPPKGGKARPTPGGNARRSGQGPGRPGGSGGQPRQGGAGGRDAGDRKKRRKR
jgi:YidC/Oxa1 family membrane protein insertase